MTINIAQEEYDYLRGRDRILEIFEEEGLGLWDGYDRAFNRYLDEIKEQTKNG